MNIRYLFLLPALLFLSACEQVTATRGPSFVDPAFQNTRFNSLVVDTRAGNLSERKAIENSAVETLERGGMQGIPALSVLPYVQNTGETIRRRKIMNTGAQAVLEITPREKQIVRDYMPGTRYRDLRRGRHHWNRNPYYDDPFYDDPPIILEEPEARYDVTLYSLPGYDIAWTADITTRGPTGMSFDEVGHNFGREIIERLGKDGVLSARP